MKQRALQFLLLAVFTSSAIWGQINCTSGTSASTKLVCEFPLSTNVLANSSALTADGTFAAQSVAAGLDLAVATQLSQLPLATASAGTIVIIKGGAPETFNDLGPILADRAQTIGKKKFFLGATASQYVFTDIDGQPLRNFPFSYTSTAEASTVYTKENLQGSLVVNQFVIVGTAGVTPKLDLSVIVPITRVSVGAGVPSSTNYVVSGGSLLFPAQPGATSYYHGNASGVGDVEASFKYALYVGEHTTFSAGSFFRMPSGDALNLLGSGAWGFNPFLAYSYLAKVSPHAKIGYQWNTASELNNPTYTNPLSSATTSTSACGTLVCQPNKPLPGGVQYNMGGDWAMSKRFTVAVDLLGYQFLNVQRLVTSYVTFSTTSGNTSIPTTIAQNSSYWINDLSTGIKWDPAGSLVFSANLLTQLNNNGFRARPTPLLGIAYKF
ncbi:MAG: hypothetical protein P4K78_00770 [Terracidiphilus sp.]|nr:hypothetical protein [Terracidiphilus sp.]